MVFCARLVDNSFGVRDLCNPIVRDRYYLIRFRLTGTRCPCRGEGPVNVIHHSRLKEPNGFMMTLGEFPVALADDPLESLVNLRNGEMTRAVARLLLSVPIMHWSQTRLPLCYELES